MATFPSWSARRPAARLPFLALAVLATSCEEAPTGAGTPANAEAASSVSGPSTLVANPGGPYRTWSGSYVRFDAGGSIGATHFAWAFNQAGIYRHGTGFYIIWHKFDLPGVKTVRLRVTGVDGSQATGSTTVNVEQNLPPVAVIANGDITVDEGTTVTFSSAGSGDPNVGQGLGYSWSNGSHRPNAPMTFRDNATARVTLRVGDSSGASATDTVVATVLNVAPTARLLASSTEVPENTPFRLGAGNVKDPGEWDRQTLTFAFDCGSGYGAYQGSPNVTCPGGPQGTDRAVGLKVRDKDGGENEYRRTLPVVNVRPVMHFVSAGQTENAFTLAFTLSDPGGGADAPYRYRVVWGDGLATSWVQAAPGAVHVTRRPYAPGSYTILAYVMDADDGVRSITRHVTIP
jgi:PKD domain